MFCWGIRSNVKSEDVLFSLSRAWLPQSFSALLFKALLFPWFVWRFGFNSFFHFECLHRDRKLPNILPSDHYYWQVLEMTRTIFWSIVISRKVCLNGTVDLFTTRLLQDLFDFIYQTACLYGLCIDRVRKLKAKAVFSAILNSKVPIGDVVWLVLNSSQYTSYRWMWMSPCSCNQSIVNPIDNNNWIVLCSQGLPTRIHICVKIAFLQRFWNNFWQQRLFQSHERGVHIWSKML